MTFSQAVWVSVASPERFSQAAVLMGTASLRWLNLKTPLAVN
jgi:hypothetical protein